MKLMNSGPYLVSQSALISIQKMNNWAQFWNVSSIKLIRRALMNMLMVKMSRGEQVFHLTRMHHCLYAHFCSRLLISILLVRISFIFPASRDPLDNRESISSSKLPHSIKQHQTKNKPPGKKQIFTFKIPLLD